MTSASWSIPPWIRTAILTIIAGATAGGAARVALPVEATQAAVAVAQGPTSADIREACRAEAAKLISEYDLRQSDRINAINGYLAGNNKKLDDMAVTIAKISADVDDLKTDVAVLKATSRRK